MKRIIAFLLMMCCLTIASPNYSLAEGVTIIGQDTSAQNTFRGETELKPGETIKVAGAYSIAFSWCTINGKNKILRGSHYIYLTSKENGASCVRFEHPVGTHAPGELAVTLINRSKQNVNWLKHVKCTVVYDETYSFDTIVTQWNPDQLDADGDTCDSTEAVDVEPLVSVDIGFIFALPYIVRDSSKSLVAYVSVDQDVYSIDLRKYMEIKND